MIVLHQYEISPFCDKIRRVLRFKKQPFETREVTVWSALGGLKKRNPAGKVPFIEVHGETICDSTEIALWADRTFPDPPLLPMERAHRALVHVLEDWADESLYWFEVYLRFAIASNANKWAAEVAKHDAAPIRLSAPLTVPRAMVKSLEAQGTGRKSLSMVLNELDRQLDAVDGLLARVVSRRRVADARGHRGVLAALRDEHHGRGPTRHRRAWRSRQVDGARERCHQLRLLGGLLFLLLLLLLFGADLRLVGLLVLLDTLGHARLLAPRPRERDLVSTRIVTSSECRLSETARDRRESDWRAACRSRA
jgi:glutathione S-transferase